MAISIADSSCSPTSSLGLLLDPEKLDPPRPKQSMWHRLGLRKWLGRDDRDFSSRSPTSSGDSSPTGNHRSKRNNSHSHSNGSGKDSTSHTHDLNRNSTPPDHNPSNHSKSHDNLTRRLSRKVGVGLPRSATFKRQNSERRDRLSPIDNEPRRAVSADRRTLSAQRTRSPQPVVDPRLSAPEVHWRDDPDASTVDDLPETNEEPMQDNEIPSEWNPYPHVTDVPEEPPADILDMELEKRWILNLSMHFRDRSEREKFFVTYAEAPNRWRRVTISCDYRDAPPDSLEHDLKELRYQRDKCARIYESIRESLPDIQFYDTVTNLKLETRDGRLHVHVTEDVNEIIPYPPISCIGHLPEARLIPERRLHFETHLSGFVYNVRLDGRAFIKKEIPGPDTVDEFLYEINALHALYGTPNVIRVEGIVVDDREEVVKGLLISFAEKGALVDILYEYRGTIAWERRERWAKQIVQGLCEIHEAGYVQGDFTLSNIVVDANDDAKIIDINRRGCPVGWEPPEIAAKIESNQRISMYIGVKTDLFQLGMTLWALAMEEDEPERQRRPFVIDEDFPIPDYYRRLVSICLSPIPRHRLSAKELLTFFPRVMSMVEQPPRVQPTHTSLGVGLHNGALPWYDARTAFMYPRGRPVTSFGHNPYLPRNGETQSPQNYNDFEQIPPSPGTEPVTISPESEPQTNTDEIWECAPAPTLSNGAHREEIMHSETLPPTQQPKDSGIPVEASGSAFPLPATPEDPQGPPEDTTQEYEENGIDLDASVDTRYRDSSTVPTADLLPFNADSLPDELAGVGGHPACYLRPPSSNHLVIDPARGQDSPESSVPTQSTYNYPVLDLGHAVIQDQDWTRQAPSGSMSSLLQSVLPINPAATLSDQKILDTTVDSLIPLSIHSSLGYRRPALQEHTPYLNDSHLPINPAFTDNALTSI
ncbi:hypothetical protein ARAM_006841 [Aspergillus rambellii]|uniref:Protein kinase domain-containing protein n=1 Tax=Aspergillus rambellii TaxID=308745 RepID=A0A0F8WTG8_9EURO|nr:hypothetical protein ARAM_006841 [Aspergillus rambellii]